MITHGKQSTVSLQRSTNCFTLLIAVVVSCGAGCADGNAPENAKKEKPSIARIKEDRDKPGRIGRMKGTDDIGEFKPEEGKEVVSSKVQMTNPITGPLEAYDPLKQKIAEDIQIQHAVRVFQAIEGRYPKDYDEFMQKVIKANNIKLPPLSPDKQYQYDVANHRLVVVRVAAE